MAQTSRLQLLFVLLTISYVFSVEKEPDNGITATDVNGVWVNELGSVMVITATNDGTLSGNYCTGVGGGPVEPTNTITGQVGRAAATSSYFNAVPATTIGFVVTYISKQGPNIPYSVCTWSGVYRKGEEEKIDTTWLLTNPRSPGWEATNIGKDTFTRSTKQVECSA